MQKIRLKLKAADKSRNRSYDIFVGFGLLDEMPKLISSLQTKRAFIVADARLSGLRGRLERALRKCGCEVASVSLKAAESSKDYRRLFPLYARMIEAKMDRHSVLFALGGGVIGDLSGFLAGTYLRGIRWVGVPTTLLAQVDSSVGGKTGVNHPLGKNLIGVFHQPSLVICDTKLLGTLSVRDRISGFGEMLKYGLAFDPTFFEFLSRNWKAILQLEARPLEKAISRSIAWKAEVVSADELERLGLRQTLNFGHTLGHAFESATDYRYFRHGEAVLLGMRLATALSVERGYLAENKFETIEAFLGQLPQPHVPKLSLKTLLDFTKRDKKAKEGKVSFVLLKGIGRTVPDSEVQSRDLI